MTAARHGPGARPDGAPPGIIALVRRLGGQLGELVRAEVSLAKLEFRELARQTALDATRVAAALALALVGAASLATAAVLALGKALGGHYAAAAALVGLVLLLTGALLARSGMRSMSSGRGPADVAAGLRQDGVWAARELRQGLVGGEDRGPLPARAEREPHGSRDA